MPKGRDSLLRARSLADLRFSSTLWKTIFPPSFFTCVSLLLFLFFQRRRLDDHGIYICVHAASRARNESTPTDKTKRKTKQNQKKKEKKNVKKKKKKNDVQKEWWLWLLFFNLNINLKYINRIRLGNQMRAAGAMAISGSNWEFSFKFFSLGDF